MTTQIYNSYFQRVVFYLLEFNLLLQIKYMNVSEQENSDVNTQLRQLVEVYMEKHSGLTLNALAGRCGVPATTMRRLMQKGSEKEQKNALAPHSVLSLVSYLLKEKKISSLLKKIDGPIAELLNRCFDQFIFDEETSKHTLNFDLNAIFQDKTNYLIYKLAANQCGTSITEVKNIFGLSGLQKLSELIEKKWLVVDSIDSEKFHARDKNFSVDIKLAHQLSHSLIDFYKPCDVGHGYNLFYSLSEGMNEKGIKKIKEIEKEAVQNIFTVMNAKEFHGDIAYFAMVLSDVLGITPTIDTKGVLQ